MIFGKHINRYYLKYAWMLLLGLFALIIVDVGQLLIPELYRMVVNGMNLGQVEYNGTVYPFDMDFLLDKICFPLIIIILVIVVGRFLWRVAFFGAAIKVETDIRDRMFNHSRKLAQQYYQVNKVGDLMSLFTNDLETVQDCYGNGVLMFFDAAFLGTLAFIKMLRMNIVLTVLSLIPMLFLFISGNIVGKRMSEKWERRQESFSMLSDFAQESFSGIAVIKAFAKETKELLAFKILNKDNERTNVEYTKVSTLLMISVTLFVESIVAVILGYGGYLVKTGVFEAGEMVEFIGYFTAIIWPIEAIAFLIEMSSKGAASLQRIGELLDSNIDVKDEEGLSDIDDDVFKGRIEFRHMNFTYPLNDREVLHDVSFEIEPGENVGILGRTGSGKTTIVDLIARTYNVDRGTLFIDGMDVNDIPIKTLRRQLAYVPQDNFLFSETIAENIAFSLKDKNEPDRDEQVSHAAKMADVYDNIKEFPDGFDTVLGERGVTVSGGQKQRISIARALLKKAKIMILDDSVSAVDTKTEKNILTNLKNERSDMTTILIAHRISTMENMDKIIFVDDGRIVDVGSHEVLYERCDEYREMVDSQKIEDERRDA
ncbi:MAG: ABC transporter ATP-binding protein/permease [Lachnospiraceae bacterium]|nr:ABC transporter ATP-binding protein/permease [Lachnospiraceae bacterium]